ncbi:hypothetical protein PHSY_007066 [Pseudozyma hubeiensis SY62]|uniref:Pentatricopeptide repeat protein n=1 Tax=Pseudozyma hubeiensis (strain SY62) TaxID=1305764 RepID=R9PMX7_PSEHS|nr:hypothetical protein PHSY_007066 [Pseudozyma hubeiensis SY62]GAC99465.1 hypothetical protein PHSY_007066 [Pseudozyma hubeiensis SY62]
MLPLLLPPPSLVRASSQLSRTLKVKQVTRLYIRLSSTSTPTLLPNVSDIARDGEDQEDRDDQQRVTTKSAAFSHFFDARTPLPVSSNTLSSNKPKASHEITSASRQAVANLRQAIRTRAPVHVIQAYGLLVQAHQRHAHDVQDSSSRALDTSQISFPVRKNDIQTAIKCLIQHAQTGGRMDSDLAKACQQMFDDMGQRFGFRIGPTDLHRQLHIQCLSKRPASDICNAFEQLRTKHPEWRTTWVDWNMVISHLVNRRKYEHAVKVWQDMLGLGVEPEEDLRRTMERVYTAINKTIKDEDDRPQLAQEETIVGTDSVATTIMSLCEQVSIGHEHDSELGAKLHAHVGQLRQEMDSCPRTANDTTAWNALLRYEAFVGGPAHALQTAKQAYRPDLFDASTLSLLLRLHTEELNDLQSSDEALELLDQIQTAIDPKRSLTADDQCYSVMMLGLLHNSSLEDAAQPSPNQIREAQLLYDHVRSIGLPPTPLLVKPLLVAYCEAFLPSLPSAIRLVDDLLESLPASSRKSTASKARKANRPATIDMAIILSVIEACVKLKDIASARNFVSRLYEAGVVISATDLLLLMRRLMGIATSWSEAFHIYRSLNLFPTWSSAGLRTPTTGLDERGYLSLLDHLRTLTFSDPASPSLPLAAPPEELLGILHDMRSADHRPTCIVYTSILDYYSKTPTPSYVGVQATHEMLKRDEGLEPDLPLINALMNAYNRVGEPAMVLAIWDSLIATRQEIDGVTLSVFFDTAGRHGLLSLARKAMGTVRRLEAEGVGGGGRSVLTKGAWDSWLECLARCGRLEEAIELSFGEMRKSLFREALDRHDFDVVDDGGGLTVNELLTKSAQAPVKDRRGHVVGPDAKTFGVLLRFAARERDRRQKRYTAGLLPGPPSEARIGGSVIGGTSVWHTLKNRIREELSWLYPQVKHVGEQTSL